MSAPIPSVDRATLRAVGPDRYLAGGWFDPAGRPRAELTAVWATAAAEQMRAGRVAVQELEATLEAFRQVAPYYERREPFDVGAMATESLDLVAQLLGQPNNPALVAWIEPCIARVEGRVAFEAFLLHLRAVLLRYGAIVAAAPPRA